MRRPGQSSLSSAQTKASTSRLHAFWRSEKRVGERPPRVGTDDERRRAAEGLAVDTTPSHGRLDGARAALVRAAERLAVRRSRRHKAAAALIAAAVFSTAFVIAYTQLPPLAGEVRWPLFAVAAAIVPVTLFLNGAEYKIAARLAGYSVATGPAVKVGVLASAANLLPLPGAVAVRAAAIHRLGGNLGKVAAATAFVGLGFLGTAALFTGVVLLTGGSLLLGAVVLALGVFLQCCALGLAIGQVGVRPALGLVAVLLLVETGSVLSKAVRYYVILRALQFEPSLLQVTALTIMSVAAIATGFFPGGLGLSEVLAGAISPLVNLPVAVGVLTSGIDHLLHIAVLSAATAIILFGAGRGSVAFARASRASLAGSAQDEDERRHDR